MNQPFTITNDKSQIDVEYVHKYLSERSFWAKGRDFDTVKKSIENAFCFSIHHGNGKQVGFARVITDYSTFAYLSDVFIDEKYRGKGLSKMLLQNIMEHPDLSNIIRWMLLTKDAHGLYARFGFTNTTISNWIMEIVQNEI